MTRRQTKSAVLLITAAIAFVLLPVTHAVSHLNGVQHRHGGVSHSHDTSEYMSREELFALLRSERSQPTPVDSSTSLDHGTDSPEHLQVALLTAAAVVFLAIARAITRPPLALRDRIHSRLHLSTLALPRGPPLAV